MSIYFPTALKNKIDSEIVSNEFYCGDTKVMISSIPANCKLSAHKHSEAQFGLSLQGVFEMEVDGQRKLLQPLKDAYFVGSNILHSAKNSSSELAIGLDIKRLINENDAGFMKPTDEKELKTGMSFSFFTGSWFEIMIAKIPPGGKMNVHNHKHEQIGIGVIGKYIMTVGEEEQEFEYGKVYFAPSNTPHSAYNPFPEEACSVNIFVPPRYGRKARKAFLA
ncbi:cupin domain-containing protein [Nodosilinea sp. E11]|uniref:cupin domain-containing protein n=1 Tax=Nodosilinea sp. E11 TaxID=3037479 RepID=UPI0029347D2B|nr:cupin domain-containing protein [Nodosilinea sp. E11]WOD37247.1 cupin domain-containing protein [Nodosilinea sp. E11]